MKKFIMENMEFLNLSDDNIHANFFTALNDISFKKSTEEGRKNIEKAKNIFKLEDMFYLNQIHSDKFIECIDNSIIYKGDVDGDALIISKKNVGIGVFAADCTPVLVYDKEKQIVGAIHSGWKGTFDEITKKVCKYMINKHNCKNLKVIIGPHIGQCCYEVSEDLANKFKEKFGDDVVSNRNLSLQKCIIRQIEDYVDKDNIKCLNKCTFCDDSVKLHSFRKDKDNSGRMFACIYIK